jgi:hypothetical protein
VEDRDEGNRERKRGRIVENDPEYFCSESSKSIRWLNNPHDFGLN